MISRWHLKGPNPFAVQLKAMQESEGHDRFGYFLEQGLGKTPLLLNDYVERYAGDVDTITIISPNTFKMDWTLAPSEWGLDFTTSMWPKQPFKYGTLSRPHLNSVNFEAVRSGAGLKAIIEHLSKRPVVLAIDESSAIKNPSSETAKAILDMSKYAKYVRLLNGTPMVQNAMDLYAQLKVLGQLKGVKSTQFKHHFAVLGGYQGRLIVGIKNVDELHDILNSCSFRALKEDWWDDCPQKLYPSLHVEMTNNQQKHYKEMYQDFYTVVQGEEFTAELILTQMDKLRQISSGIIMDGDVGKLIDPIEKNPKFRASLDVMENGTGKMVVVHFYTKLGDELLKGYVNKGLNPAFIKGGMKPEELIEQKKKFNDDPTCRIIVCQIASSYMAHTLLGGPGNDRSHKMYFHDQTFSLLQRSQMEDRIHRGAQDRACLYYDPVCSSIDEAQLLAIKNKQNMVDTVINAVRATPRPILG